MFQFAISSVSANKPNARSNHMPWILGLQYEALVRTYLIILLLPLPQLLPRCALVKTNDAAQNGGLFMIQLSKSKYNFQGTTVIFELLEKSIRSSEFNYDTAVNTGTHVADLSFRRSRWHTTEPQKLPCVQTYLRIRRSACVLKRIFNKYPFNKYPVYGQVCTCTKHISILRTKLWCADERMMRLWMMRTDGHTISKCPSMFHYSALYFYFLHKWQDSQEIPQIISFFL